MKTILWVLAFALAGSSVVFGPPSSTQNLGDKFVGVWRSLDKENSEPLAEVTLTKIDDKLSGSVLLRGLIQDGKNLSLELPIIDVTVDGKSLSFKLVMQDKDEKAVTLWEFLLRENEEARFSILKDSGKPVEDGPVFVMKRVKSESRSGQ